MSDLSGNFARAYTFKESFGASRPQEGVGDPFILNDLVGQKKGAHRKFSFDSESSQNFDQTNVDRAREGVKEIVNDAINKARRKSSEIKEQARKEGYEIGYAEGFQKGEDSAKQEFAPLLLTLNDLLRVVGDLRRTMYPKVEREMVEMILDLAKKIIHHELSTREDSVKEMIRIAVESVLDKEKMIIRINPADKIYAESFRPEILQLFEETKSIIFEAHPSIEKGGCIIESNFGTVDARIEKLNDQIDKILNLAPPAPENIET
ncbi:MAG: hypothetical protein A3K09_01020 [Nitrospinae bacterium RIFCSPLOWO2_12_FULL_47_7]|nr:MAG: hypothetical protein A3K09_01020 [Nitrospinae bacterium RIFCSPLOWO2_12_FULL_47_7]